MTRALDWRISYNQSSISHSFFHCNEGRRSQPMWWSEQICLPSILILKAVFSTSPIFSGHQSDSISFHVFLQLGVSNWAQYSNSSHNNDKQRSNITSPLPGIPFFTDQSVTVHLYATVMHLRIDANLKKIAAKSTVLFPRVVYQPLHTKSIHFFQEFNLRFGHTETKIISLNPIYKSCASIF